MENKLEQKGIMQLQQAVLIFMKLEPFQKLNEV